MRVSPTLSAISAVFPSTRGLPLRRWMQPLSASASRRDVATKKRPCCTLLKWLEPTNTRVIFCKSSPPPSGPTCTLRSSRRAFRSFSELTNMPSARSISRSSTMVSLSFSESEWSFSLLYQPTSDCRCSARFCIALDPPVSTRTPALWMPSSALICVMESTPRVMLARCKECIELRSSPPIALVACVMVDMDWLVFVIEVIIEVWSSSESSTSAVILTASLSLETQPSRRWICSIVRVPIPFVCSFITSRVSTQKLNLAFFL
mmetsp:Transcript_27546/g.48684  ORF Transcript_27546/g.48684 Transcript_27546/m.48684 type:complete len:262 (-) Transcript_27546:69-854(-)